jgi:hypothetical protein
LASHSITFDQAIAQFRLIPHRKPEFARALFTKAAFLESLGSDEHVDVRTQAVQLVKEVKLELKGKKESEFELKDFDGVVSIWSR